MRDDLTEDVDTPLASHPLNVAPAGVVWINVNPAQSFTVIAATGKARASGTGATARVDMGGPDHEFSIQFDPRGGDNRCAIQLRRNGATETCYQATLRVGVNQLVLARRPNGQATQLVTLTLPISKTVAHRLRGRVSTVDTNSVNLRVWLDEALNPLIDYSDTSAQRLTAGDSAGMVH